MILPESRTWPLGIRCIHWGLGFVCFVSGWMQGLDAFWGDESLEEIHKFIGNALMGLVAIHLIGIARDAIIHKRKSWMSMVDG